MIFFLGFFHPKHAWQIAGLVLLVIVGEWLILRSKSKRKRLLSFLFSVALALLCFVAQKVGGQ